MSLDEHTKDGSDKNAYLPSNGAILRTPLGTNGVSSFGFLGRLPRELRYEWDGKDLWVTAATIIGTTGIAAAVGGPAATGNSFNPKSLSVLAGLDLYNVGNASSDLAIDNSILLSLADSTTTTFTGADIKTYNAKSIMFLIDVTAFTGTSYVPEIQWKDGAGNYRSLWQQKTPCTGVKWTIVNVGIPPAGGGSQIGSATVGDAATAVADSATVSQLVTIPFLVMPIMRIVVTKTVGTGYVANMQVVAQGS